MSVRNKGMAGGFNKCSKPCVKPAMESRGCLWVEADEEDSPENATGRKVPPVPISDDEDVSILCACLSLTDGESPLLGWLCSVIYMSSPC